MFKKADVEITDQSLHLEREWIGARFVQLKTFAFNKSEKCKGIDCLKDVGCREVECRLYLRLTAATERRKARR